MIIVRTGRIRLFLLTRSSVAFVAVGFHMAIHTPFLLPLAIAELR